MNTFKQNIINIHKEKGEAWLDELPHLVKNIAAAWNLSDLQPVKNLSYHYVLSGFQKKEPVILKLYPENESLNNEVSALEVFSNYGAVKILNKTNNALLLKRAVSGESLKNYFPNKDREATKIICKIITKLHQAPLPQNNKFRSIENILKPIDKDWPQIHPIHLEKARKLKKELIETSMPPVSLHGDLHHENILSSGKDWVAIDPKGFIGESAYETTAFIRNPMSELLKTDNPEKIILDRINLSSELLNSDKERIIAWCFVQSILSHIWCLEDNINPKYFINLTGIFIKLV